MRAVERGGLNISFRIRVAMGVVITAFLLIMLRLWYLQVLKGDYFRFRSENNLLRTIYVPPPRGVVLDRHGEVLVTNRPSFDIEFVSEDSPDPEDTIRTLASILQLNPDELLERLKEQKRRRRFEPKLVLKDANRDVVARVVARRHLLPGIMVTVVPTRKYVYGELAAHTLGYIREITKDQLESPYFSGYMRGDLVGQYGLESRWESYLRGDRGIHTIVVNAAGTKIGERSFRPEIIGHNVVLTLDRAMQQRADDQLRDKKGAVVALDVRTGEVLALASSPRFDPNVFTGELTPEVWRDLVGSKERKMNNRAIQGTYAPGSVFKIFMAIAALEEGVMRRNETVFCPGYYSFGGRQFKCHKHSGHGTVDLMSAMAQSCDVYFYTAGQRLGVDRIHEYATKFGLGQLTGIELFDEAKGIIPSTAWKKAYFKRPEDKKWYPGETISVAIGQGAVTVTPLQIARSLAAVVNGGKVLRPYLVKRIESNQGDFRDDNFGPSEVEPVKVDPEIIRLVRASMVGVVADKRGTGHRAALDKSLNISVGGKTGTAQVVSLHREGEADHFKDHAWFSGYAPAENPEIVVVALIENGGHGGAAAAPVVRAVMEAYFGKDMPAVPAGDTGEQSAD